MIKLHLIISSGREVEISDPPPVRLVHPVEVDEDLHRVPLHPDHCSPEPGVENSLKTPGDENTEC